jgi:hypothetical protein
MLLGLNEFKTRHPNMLDFRFRVCVGLEFNFSLLLYTYSFVVGKTERFFFLPRNLYLQISNLLCLCKLSLRYEEIPIFGSFVVRISE